LVIREPDPVLDELASAVIGAAVEVHRHLGPGFLESVYEQAMKVELSLQGVPFRAQHPVPVWYKDHDVGEGRVDLLVGEQLVVELKAVDRLLPIHQAQVVSYLRAVRCHLGLLINFKVEILKAGVKRVILST